MRTLNLGILAHVDAGKTSLTERMLYSAGIIDHVGSVDDGSTQTDSLPLEQQRGITIKSAVVSFAIGDVTVNLIDTPGHPDFIAEVERVLNVLDGVVLVLSAVEGVQSQTRVLMRTLQRLGLPTLLFVNKIDRGGARPGAVLREIAERLTPAAVPMGTVRDPGTRGAAFVPRGPRDAVLKDGIAAAVAEYNDAFLFAYVNRETAIPYGKLRVELAAQTSRALVHPVFFGSAITGAGIDTIMTGLTELLPTSDGDASAPVTGTVFKVERGSAGEKVAFVRLFTGTVNVRDRLQFGGRAEGKVTAISVFHEGSAVPRTSGEAGQIAKLWGLDEVRVGDAIGDAASGEQHYFPPPTLETAVVPRNARDKGALYAALEQLAEQDPLINLRQDDIRKELYVSLYGEVQKEVIQATLAADYNLEVKFRETTTVYIERPLGTGEAEELLQEETNPFRATIGLRIEPAPAGHSIDFRLDIDPRTAPTHIFKNVEGFKEMMGQYVRAALQEGLRGWQVTDCTVTMIRCDYSIADGPPSMRGPDSTAADFRKLTPLVVMAALQKAGTVVCEPLHRFRLEIPADAFGATSQLLARLRAVPLTQEARGAAYVMEGDIPVANVNALQQGLRPLTHGEGVLEHAFERYQPAIDSVPHRPRTDLNPLNRKEYLLHVLRRV